MKGLLARGGSSFGGLCRFASLLGVLGTLGVAAACGGSEPPPPPGGGGGVSDAALDSGGDGASEGGAVVDAASEGGSGAQDADSMGDAAPSDGGDPWADATVYLDGGCPGGSDPCPAPPDGCRYEPDPDDPCACGVLRCMCGGRFCGDGEYCSYATEGACSGAGVCMARPASCDALDDPVCGCDMSTYANRCDAHSFGVSVAHAGPCDDSMMGDCRDSGCPSGWTCEMCGAGYRCVDVSTGCD